MARGRLRVYLGAAPGVGKTFAMLNEGWRGKQRGKDVVVGYVETHGRANTEAQIRDLEVVPRRKIEYRGREFEEMDVDAILARKPQLVLVDEIAHTNVPGSSEREAVAGRRRAARGRYRRRHDTEHAAPRVGQRRRRADHRRQAARDHSGRRRPSRRAGRAGRHDAGGAPPPHGPREHLPAGADRRLARQLLPTRQPRRAPGARPALGGRQGRRVVAGLHGRPRDPGPVGDPRAHGRRDHRRPRRGSAHPARRADGDARARRALRRARALQRRAHRPAEAAPGRAPGAADRAGRHVPRDRR